MKTAADAKLLGDDDVIQLAFATSEGRVLVTHDGDFLRLNAAGTTHAGIAYAAQGSLTFGDILRRLVLISELSSAEEMTNRVEYL